MGRHHGVEREVVTKGRNANCKNGSGGSSGGGGGGITIYLPILVTINNHYNHSNHWLNPSNHSSILFLTSSCLLTLGFSHGQQRGLLRLPQGRFSRCYLAVDGVLAPQTQRLEPGVNFTIATGRHRSYGGRSPGEKGDPREDWKKYQQIWKTSLMMLMCSRLFSFFVVRLKVSLVANLEVHNYQQRRGLRPVMQEIYSYMSFHPFPAQISAMSTASKSISASIKILQRAFHDLGFRMP